MRIIRNPQALQRVTTKIRQQGKTIGFVPTMGALHEGHLSLIRRARRDTDAVIVSLFVNPIQFTQRRDYATYPRPFARDAARCRAAGADYLFAPTARALYRPGFQTVVEVTKLSRRWEGERRPGHFRGVATVVTKLFHLAQPTIAYCGEKDAQQARLIQQMARDLDWPLRVVVCPTVREPDGLAMSSRNVRLSPTGRRRAAALYDALQAARRLIESGERRRAVILRRMRDRLGRVRGARLEYAAVVDPDTLEPVTRVHGDVRLLLAVWIGTVRLIDTMRVSTRRR